MVLAAGHQVPWGGGVLSPPGAGYERAADVAGNCGIRVPMREAPAGEQGGPPAAAPGRRRR